MIRPLAAALFISVLAPPALGPFLPYYALPATVSIVDANYTVDEQYGEAWMPFGGNDNLKRGHHVASRLTFSGVELTDDNAW